jgi:1-acyl-sn-glycerol-3-phosphate acyltransferase
MENNTSAVKRFLFYLLNAGTGIGLLPLAHHAEGAENLPKGAFIAAVNHRSFLDGVLVVNELNRILRKPVHMISYAEMEHFPIAGKFMTFAGCIYFDRSSMQSRAEVLKQALGFLKINEPVGVFPEARLSVTGKMRRGRPGAAVLALESGVPVVPIGLKNTEKIIEPGTGKFRFGTRASMEIGFPLDFSPLQDKFLNGTQQEREGVILKVTNSIMLSIAKLSGQEYTHTKPLRKRKAGNVVK